MSAIQRMRSALRRVEVHLTEVYPARRAATMAKTHAPLPAAFGYQPDLLDPDTEIILLAQIRRSEFRNFEFDGYEGKRRVVSFGWRYAFGAGGLQKADDIPIFLLPLRERAAAFAGPAPTDLAHVPVTENATGAPIGWHRDKAVFGDVIGISLYASCTLRFRRKHEAGWQRVSLTLAARSAYLLRGPARTEWEHSIPPVRELR